MKTENILLLEDNAEGIINLVRDSLFWQAWNRSAFLFTMHLKKDYQVQKRFIKKVSQEVAWIGFPSSTLDTIRQIAEKKGFKWEQKSADHIIISNVTQSTGYEEWWSRIVKKKPKPSEPNFATTNDKNANILAAYKTAYDLCLHVHRATVKMPREFRYELGARVRNQVTDITENLHLAVNNIKASPDIGETAARIHRFRIDIRILKDLYQININQWGFLNNQIETLLNLLRAEFRDLRIAGATHNQSSGTLPPNNSASISQNRRDSFL